MKFNCTVELNNHNNIEDLEDKIIAESARQMINEVMNNRYEHWGKTYREKLRDEVRKMILEDILTPDFKKELYQLISEELSNRFTKTKQYREIKNCFDIESDSLIKSGMKDIISDLVNTELRKRFK